MTCTPRESVVFRAVNAQRRSHGLGVLDWSDAVCDVARRHSASMAARGFFDHHDPATGDVGGRLTAARVSWRACGENIAQNKGFADPEGAAVHGWMQSAGHRANILSELWTSTGLGVVERGDGLLVFTQVFVRP